MKYALLNRAQMQPWSQVQPHLNCLAPQIVLLIF